MEINGKPLNRWIEEQKSKDGTLYIRRGTIKTAFGTSMYQGAVVTQDNEEDRCYYDADISIHIGGKDYQMKGSRVERKNGRWLVDGKPFPLPEIKGPENTSGEPARMVVNGDKVVFGKNCRRIDVVGMANIGCDMSGAGIVNVINQDPATGKVSFHGDKSTGTSGRHVVISKGTVRINRGGNTYTIKGDNIEKRDGQWYADDQPVDWERLGGQYKEKDVVNIEINGNVQDLTTSGGDVTVNGLVTNLRTGSGNVVCDTAGNVNTGSGDVHCKHITGKVSTGSGDIYR